jgi:hypothetical protein
MVFLGDSLAVVQAKLINEHTLGRALMVMEAVLAAFVLGKLTVYIISCSLSNINSRGSAVRVASNL